MTKSLIKRIFAIVFYYTGAFGLVRFVNNLLGKRLTIVTYHRITDEQIDQIQYSLPYLFVNINTFEKHLSFYQRKYNVMSFKDLPEYKKKWDIPKNSLIITFDDGYADNLSNALPLLQKHAAPLTIFVVTEMLKRHEVPWWDEVFARLRLVSLNEGENNKRKLAKDYPDIQKKFTDNPVELFQELNRWEKPRINSLLERLRSCTKLAEEVLRESNMSLSWRDLKDVPGIVNLGSHGCSHASLNGLDGDSIKEEVWRSKEEIERESGHKVLAFSYPAGHHGKELEHIVQESGYLYAVTQDRGINSLKNKYSIRRINIWEGLGKGLNGGFSKSSFALALSAIY